MFFAKLENKLVKRNHLTNGEALCSDILPEFSFVVLDGSLKNFGWILGNDKKLEHNSDYFSVF